MLHVFQWRWHNSTYILKLGSSAYFPVDMTILLSGLSSEGAPLDDSKNHSTTHTVLHLNHSITNIVPQL